MRRQNSTKVTRIAALITCYNRRDTTLACLEALRGQQDVDDVQLQVYLVDDGCTDGTGDAVRSRFPEVKVLKGDGSLYWCGAMRVAFEEAMKEDYDYYLWLNNDTTLLPGAICILLETAHKIRQSQGNDGIIVGSTCDPETGKRTYGGVKQVSKWRPLDSRPVEPLDKPQPCDTMNGNCVLIPRIIAKSVGNLSPEFTHAVGDIDYGLRAKAMGFSNWVAPGYIGTCCSSRNRGRCFDPRLPLRERLKILHSPMGLPPREWRIFTRRHTGIHWPFYWLKLYVHVISPRLWAWLRRLFVR